MTGMFKVAAIVGLATAWACSEPTSCASDGSQCLPPAHVVGSPLAAPVAIVGQPAAKAAAASGRRPARLVGSPHMAADDPRAVLPSRVAMPPLDTMAARGRPPTVPEGQADAAPDARIPLFRLLLAEALPAIKAHDAQALAKSCSPRYSDNLKQVVVTSGERLWRHLDRYPTVLGNTAVQISVQPSEDSRVQLLVAAAGIELKPIVVQSDGQWKIDRF